MKLLGELAALVGGTIEGDPKEPIHGVSPLETALGGDLSFYGHNRYKQALIATKASAVLVSPETPHLAGKTFVRVKQPHLAFARISQLFHPPRYHPPGRSDRASIHAEARIDPSATVMAFATVDRGAQIGAGAVLYPGVYVGENAIVGDASVLHANVTLEHGCVIGKRCIVHAGSVIGADGFGFAFDAEKAEHVKIPQAGIARLEDDVELGACTCIDRATLGETLIGRGTKVDNLVQVAHNVSVGQLSLLCAQVGISGSSKLGQGVVLGGQVGIAGHLKIGDLAMVGAQAGVAHDVEAGAKMQGAPAFDVMGWMHASTAFQKLPQMVKELRALRKRVDELEKGEKK
jgi:UDP-3-O-[3-hydroxymyristoyl] glucosamine N-acyltransferase